MRRSSSLSTAGTSKARRVWSCRRHSTGEQLQDDLSEWGELKKRKINTIKTKLNNWKNRKGSMHKNKQEQEQDSELSQQDEFFF